jgi:superfamily II DNA/RNA helicase
MLGSSLGCYSGDGGQVWDGQDWQRVAKAEITERLTRGDLTVLVCTDAASEGLNLQAASALVNYDLPWNPSKVDQRIGRIDRIGQQQLVLPIRNMFLTRSVDMQVYHALRDRCGLFEHFVGPMQPVLALARQALRRSLSPQQIPSLIADIRRAAEAVSSDATVAGAFASASAAAADRPPAVATREDIEDALARLASARVRVKAKRERMRPVWRVQGASRRNVRVTMDSETLDLDRKAEPITAGVAVVDAIAERLPLPGYAPLVLATACDGPYRCDESRWVQQGEVQTVRSAEHLRSLLDSWDGSRAPVGLLARAREEARQAARERVRRMIRRAKQVERDATRQQTAACRSRLLRELARNLRCLGTGDLNTIFRDQLRRETETDGRHRRALHLLGGFPNWSPEEVRQADAFVAALSTKERQARVNLAAELEAALNDPRWHAHEGESRADK